MEGYGVQRAYSNSTPTYIGESAPPQPTGIATAMQELAQEVAEASQRAENLRSALGISQPSDPQQKNPSQPALVDTLRDLTYRLRKSNADLGDVLRHLTS